jgi:TRAP-type C4-dicarboxylate transport system permease small subunit
MTTDPRAIDLIPAREPAPDPIGWLIFAFLGGPAAWTLHLLLMVFFVSNRFSMGNTTLRILLIVITIVLTLVCVASAVVGWRGWEPAERDHGKGLDEPLTRSSFMARSGVLMGILFAIATLAEGIPIVLVRL